jgi:hypothetical protein
MLNLLKVAIPTLLLLTSCETKGSEVLATGPTTNPCVFIAVKTYSKKFNQELANEVLSASPDQVWTQAIRDYRQLRLAVQACKS